MAYYEKVGLLVLNEEQTKFLVCEPGGGYGFDTQDSAAQQMRKKYLMPGGKFEQDETDEECIKREIREELGTEVEEGSLEFIADYTDVAASHPDRDVLIKLYRGKLLSEPTPHAEIGALHWIGKEDVGNDMASVIIRNKIIPDLVMRGVLR